MSGSRRTDGREPSAIVGWPDGADLVRLILDGSDRVIAGVSGPGGSGKSTLLERMADELRAGGVEVVHGLDPSARTAARPDRLVLLVDDAQHLALGELAVLNDVVAEPGPHVVIAYRPAPAAPLVDALEQSGRRPALVTLHPMSEADVRARAATLLGAGAPEVDIARVLEQTRGNPRLVDLVLTAVRDDAWDPGASGSVPDAVLAHVADECDALEPAAREYLLALAVGFGTAAPAFSLTSRFSHDGTRALMGVARSSGLAAPDGTVPTLIREAILRTAPADEAWSLRRELVDSLEAEGLPLGETAVVLARQGFRDARIAAALESRADAVLAADPRAAWRLYALAIDAGADEASTDARRAVAAWAGGDIRTAERLVDRMLARTEGADPCRAVGVAAALWARQGMLTRSADAYARLADDDCALGPLAVACLAAVGEIDRARSLRTGTREVPYPTSSHVAVDLTADGLLLAIEGEGDRALAALLRASSVLSESTELVPLPDAPAVFAAIVAMNAGELGIADDALASAITASQGGPVFRARLLLMRALVALRADRPVRAREHLDAAEGDAVRHPLGLRDELLAYAVRVGLARHQGEIPVLMRAWNAARPAIAAMQVDLTTLPVLGELAVAAARLGQTPLVETHLAAAWDLLGRVGHPAPWTTSLRWTEIEAALLRNDPDAVERHASLLDAASGDRNATRLANAGRTWAAALAGDVTVARVEQAVRDLVAVGYPWDAARLAGHAAGRAADHRDSLDLLALARSLHPEEPVPGPPGAGRGDGATGPERTGDGGPLSAREREVARLVLEGKTYVEIGQAIFISPRTAEHHIARMRRRLGASTRSDLLAKLRLALEEDGTDQPPDAEHPRIGTAGMGDIP